MNMFVSDRRSSLFVMLALSILGLLLNTALSELARPNSSEYVANAYPSQPSATPHMQCLGMNSAIITNRTASPTPTRVGDDDRNQIARIGVPSLQPRCHDVGNARSTMHALTQPYAIVEEYSIDGELLSTDRRRLIFKGEVLTKADCLSQTGYFVDGEVFPYYNVQVFYQCCYSCQPDLIP